MEETSKPHTSEAEPAASRAPVVQASRAGSHWAGSPSGLAPVLAGLLLPLLHVSGLGLWLILQGSRATLAFSTDPLPFSRATLLIFAGGLLLACGVLLAQVGRRSRHHQGS